LDECEIILLQTLVLGEEVKVLLLKSFFPDDDFFL